MYSQSVSQSVSQTDMTVPETHRIFTLHCSSLWQCPAKPKLLWMFPTSKLWTTERLYPHNYAHFSARHWQVIYMI